MVWAGNGASLDLLITKPTWHCPSESMTLRYATAALARTDASEKTQSSLEWACERVTGTYCLGICRSTSLSEMLLYWCDGNSSCYFFLYELRFCIILRVWTCHPAILQGHLKCKPLCFVWCILVPHSVPMLSVLWFGPVFLDALGSREAKGDKERPQTPFYDFLRNFNQ